MMLIIINSAPHLCLYNPTQPYKELCENYDKSINKAVLLA